MNIIALLLLLAAGGIVVWNWIKCKRLDFHIISLYALTTVLLIHPDANLPMRWSGQGNPVRIAMNSIEGIIAYAILALMAIIYEYILYKEHGRKLPMAAIITTIVSFIFLVL